MSIEFPPQISAMQELQEAIDAVNDFYLEKHGRISAAAGKAAEDKRVRLDKAEQSRQKVLALNVILRQLRAEEDRRMRKRFFDLFRQGYLAVKRERERARKGKGRARFQAENYYPEVEEGRAGPSSESGRGSERSGSINSFAINVAPRRFSAGSTLGCLDPFYRFIPDPALDPDLHQSGRLKPGFRPPSESGHAAKPARKSLPGSILEDPNTASKPSASCSSSPTDPAAPPNPAAHGPSDNTAPQIPPAVYNATVQLQERLRGVSLGSVRAVPSQMEYDQQWQTRHQGMREYEFQATGRVWCKEVLPVRGWSGQGTYIIYMRRCSIYVVVCTIHM